MKVKFWGTRGSIPTPLPPAAIEGKIRQALRGAVGLDLSSEAAIERYLQRLPVTICSTVGAPSRGFYCRIVRSCARSRTIFE